MRYVDGSTGTYSPYESPTAGRYLKATSGWNSYNGQSGNGTDTYAFSALPGGEYSDGYFLGVGNYGSWWSASEYTSSYAYYRYLNYNIEGAYWRYNSKNSLLSVRCVQD